MIQPFSKQLTYMVIVFLPQLLMSMANAEWQWEEVDTGFPIERNDGFVVFKDKLWRFNTGNDRIFSTADGRSWVEVRPNITGFSQHVFTYSERLWALLIPSLSFASSQDGESWQIQGSFVDEFPSLVVNKILAFESAIWVVGLDGFPPAEFRYKVIQSADSTDWESCSSDVTQDTDTRLINFFSYRNQMWLHFDNLAYQCKSEFWTSTDGLVWTMKADIGGLAPQRNAFISHPFKGNLFAIGGACEIFPSSRFEFYNNVHYTDDEITWKEYPCAIPWTPRHSLESNILTFDNSIWLFGGVQEGFQIATDVWRFSDLPLSAEGEGGGEGESETFHSADINQDNILSLHELLRAIQLYNLGSFHCDASAEDGYAPGTGVQTCAPHSGDYNPQDWIIALSELLRLIQLYNAFEIDYCPNVTPPTEDSFCLAPAFHNCQPMP